MQHCCDSIHLDVLTHLLGVRADGLVSARFMDCNRCAYVLIPRSTSYHQRAFRCVRYCYGVTLNPRVEENVHRFVGKESHHRVLNLSEVLKNC